MGLVGHVDNLAVADELDVSILGPEPAISQFHSTKSGGRGILSVTGVDVSPGQRDLYSLNLVGDQEQDVNTYFLSKLKDSNIFFPVSAS